MTVPKTVALPLGYSPIIKYGGGWIRTAEPEGTVLQTVAFNQTSLLLREVCCRLLTINDYYNTQQFDFLQGLFRTFFKICPK